MFSNRLSLFMLDLFIGKTVLIETSDYAIAGKLLEYSPSYKETHRPFVLLLETQQGKALLRGDWTVKTFQKVT